MKKGGRVASALYFLVNQSEQLLLNIIFFCEGKGNMSIIELIIIAVGLSMDAFAVAVCKGLSMKRYSLKDALVIACYFGGFQALMPSLGYYLGIRFKQYIVSFDHWIAFVLLVLIGLNMVKEAKEKNCESNSSTDFKTMVILAVATSIDALTVGITFAFLSVRIVPAVSLIGAITFVLSYTGVKTGNVFGLKYREKAELTGGIILIAMGVKILIEHLFF